MKPWERNAANLSASLSFYGPGEHVGGMKLITSSVTYPMFNIALLEEPVPDRDNELARRIETARDYFNRRGREWSFWLCEGYLGRNTVRRLRPIFEAYNMANSADSPGMECEKLPGPRRHLPQLEFRRVSDMATRTAFAHLVTHCFYIPYDVSQQVYQDEAPWHTDLAVWLGYLDGFAVSSAAAIQAAGGLGIYSVATLPAWRRMGMAEAVMRHAIADQQARGARGPLILQSSMSGLDLYKRMGFQKVTQWQIYATR